jgi:hypothetical protein
MYNPKDIQFVGKHDYNKEKAERFSEWADIINFSINIFKWELKSNGKEMKPSKGIVRISGSPKIKEKVFEMAENAVKQLDAGEWDGRKKIILK